MKRPIGRIRNGLLESLAPEPCVNAAQFTLKTVLSVEISLRSSSRA
jgi:hypothetical protein